MLLKLHGTVQKGEQLVMSMKLPASNRKIHFNGHVAYVIDEGNGQPFSVGLAVDEMKSTDRNRLRNYILEIASGAAFLEYHKLLEKEEPSEEFRVEGEGRSSDVPVFGLKLRQLSIFWTKPAFEFWKPTSRKLKSHDFRLHRRKRTGAMRFFSFTP